VSVKEKKNRKIKLTRRDFLGGSLAVAAGAGLAAPTKVLGSAGRIGMEEIKIKEYRTLGRTGVKVSDISFGSGELADSALLEAILDTGVNYIDTAEGYGRGRSERIIGSVLKKRDRKKIFVTTKLGIRGNVPSKEAIIERFEKQLERLNTDYVDCLMTHGPGTVERLKNETFFAAFDELKARDRVRFCGVSNHGSQWSDAPETMENVLLAAAADGRFDVMLFVYNFIQQEQGKKILEACKKYNVGATLMKTNPVLNYYEMKANAESAEAGSSQADYYNKLVPRLKEKADKAEAFKKEFGLSSFDDIRNAALLFVLDHPDVSCACPTIKNFEDIEFYVGLSGKKFQVHDKRMLAAYEAIMGDFYCRHACDECESACPAAVPVNTIMRYNHYFMAQKREKSAMEKYASLPGNKADLCSNCSGMCEQACPFGIPAQALLALAHKTLTLV